MMPLPEIIDAIQWHEGMLLAPQHFRQLSARHEDLIAYAAGNAMTHFWGVQRLAIDPGALLAGCFRLTELEAVMPDGLVLQYRGERGDSIEVSLGPDHCNGVPVTIHLGVAARHLRSEPGTGLPARYDSDLELAANDAAEVDGEMGLSIPRLRPRIVLFAGERPAPAYVSLPLARVIHRNEKFELCDYLAPTTSIATRSPGDGRAALLELGTELAVQLRAKALYLSDKLQHGQQGSAHSSLHMRLAVQNLVADLPLLEGLLALRTVHPQQLYLTFCGLAGKVAGVSAGGVPPMPPAYDHVEPLATLQTLVTGIVQSLQQVRESCVALPFRRVPGGFELDRVSDPLPTRLTVGLQMPKGWTEVELDQWMSQTIIGSTARIKAMREKRVLGARREAIDYDNVLELASNQRIRLYAIEVQDEAIGSDEPLQIMGPHVTDSRGGAEFAYLYVKAD